MDQKWLSSVSVGCRWTFWFLLLPTVLMNFCGFLLPFVAGSLEHLKWIGLIHTVCGVGMFYGVFRLTAQPSGEASRSAFHFVRLAMRGIAGVDVVARFLDRAFRLLDVENFLETSSANFLIDLAFVVLIALYLGMVVRRLESRRLIREMSIAAFVYVVSELEVLVLYRTGVTSEWPEASNALILAVYTILFIWALTILHRFHGFVRTMLNGDEITSRSFAS